MTALGMAAPDVAVRDVPDTIDGYVARHGRADPQAMDKALPAEVDPTLLTLASWVKTVAGGTTWGHLLATTGVSRPPEVAEAWSQLMASDVVSKGVESAVEIIDEFVTQQNDARRLILFERVLGPGKQTLQELGDQIAVSRERARQLEVRVTEDLRERFTNEDRWRSVRWAAEALREHLGAFAPL